MSESLLIGTVSAEKEQCIRAYFKALSQRDWDALAALCAKDVTYHLPGTDERFSQLIRGREAFKAFSEETFESFPGAGFRVEALFPLPEGIIARYTGWWSAEPDRIAEVPGAIIFRFDENLISEIGVRVALRHLLAEMLTRPPEGESANPSPS